MKKKISITGCAACPYLAYSSEWDARCKKTNLAIPRETRSAGAARLVVAVALEGFPDWCPLENDSAPTPIPELLSGEYL